MRASEDSSPTTPPHRLYVHVAWSTLGRVDAIPKARRAAIETHMLAACRRLGAEPVEVRALADRVHLLVRIPGAMSVADLAGQVRDAVAGQLAKAGRVVRWSPGFAAVSVSPRAVRRVRKRLAMMEESEPRNPLPARRRIGRPRRGTIRS